MFGKKKRYEGKSGRNQKDSHTESKPYKPRVDKNSSADRRKMNTGQQIMQLKAQGIKFNIIDEMEAAEFLEDHTYYFRLKFYAENYDKFPPATPHAGKYFGLEFAYLKELSLLDLYLRRTLFAMVMDVEHYVKIRLLKELNSNDAEDGYHIVTEFFNRYHWIQRGIEHQKGTYAGGLIQKYKGHFAMWNIIEVITFSELIMFYNLYYEIYGGEEILTNSHLTAVRTLRNSIAHNNCLLNNLRTTDSTVHPVNKEIAALVSQIDGITNSMRKKKLSNQFLSDFTATIHAFNTIVTSEEERIMRMEELDNLLNVRFRRHEDYFEGNQVVNGAFDFMRKIVAHYR